MIPLSKWIEEERDKWPGGGGVHEVLNGVLRELKAREDAERERVNQNTAALDRLAGEVLDEKEGG